jgi:proteasome lid subunit RPN8/RPN11
MWDFLAKLFGQSGAGVRRIPPAPKLILTNACLEAVRSGLAPETQKGHEGIVFLLGRTDGLVTLAVGVFRPNAQTTRGSFHVPTAAMAQCIEAAARLELQVVGQIHTHPGQAYHSDGDVEGTRIQYAGFASLVVPNYGRDLPSLKGIAAYLWQENGTWHQLEPLDITILQGAGPWIARSGSTSGTAGHSGIAIVV